MLVTGTRQGLTMWWGGCRENIFCPCMSWSTLTVVAFGTPEIALKTCLLNLWKVTGFSEAWTCYELTTDMIGVSPTLPHLTGPSFLFLGLNLRPEKFRVWGTTWSSCPLQRFMPAAVQMVLLFFLQSLISLPIPLLSSNRWHISTNRPGLGCQYLQRSRKLSQTLQSQRCYPKKATTDTDRNMKWCLPKIIERELAFAPLM